MHAMRRVVAERAGTFRRFFPARFAAEGRFAVRFRPRPQFPCRLDGDARVDFTQGRACVLRGGCGPAVGGVWHKPPVEQGSKPGPLSRTIRRPVHSRWVRYPKACCGLIGVLVAQVHRGNAPTRGPTASRATGRAVPAGRKGAIQSTSAQSKMPPQERGDLRLGQDGGVLPQDALPRRRAHARRGPICRRRLQSGADGAAVARPAESGAGVKRPPVRGVGGHPENPEKSSARTRGRRKNQGVTCSSLASPRISSNKTA